MYLIEKFDIRRFLHNSESETITNLVGVSVRFQRLLRVPYLDQSVLSSYNLKSSIGRPPHKYVKEALLRCWPAEGLAEAYGMTQSGIMCILHAHERSDKLDTVAQPIGDCDLKINDEHSNVLVQGEIFGYKSKMMRCYANRPEATQEASWYNKAGVRYQKAAISVGWMTRFFCIYWTAKKT